MVKPILEAAEDCFHRQKFARVVTSIEESLGEGKLNRSGGHFGARVLWAHDVSVIQRPPMTVAFCPLDSPNANL
jgi:hypothetical protein